MRSMAAHRGRLMHRGGDFQTTRRAAGRDRVRHASVLLILLVAAARMPAAHGIERPPSFSAKGSSDHRESFIAAAMRSTEHAVGWKVPGLSGIVELRARRRALHENDSRRYFRPRS